MDAQTGLPAAWLLQRLLNAACRRVCAPGGLHKRRTGLPAIFSAAQRKGDRAA